MEQREERRIKGYSDSALAGWLCPLGLSESLGIFLCSSEAPHCVLPTSASPRQAILWLTRLLVALGSSEFLPQKPLSLLVVFHLLGARLGKRTMAQRWLSPRLPSCGPATSSALPLALWCPWAPPQVSGISQDSLITFATPPCEEYTLALSQPSSEVLTPGAEGADTSLPWRQ